MTRNVYTTDNPPKKGDDVFEVYPSNLIWGLEARIYQWDVRRWSCWSKQAPLEHGYLHRTRESAELHAREILAASHLFDAVRDLLECGGGYDCEGEYHRDASRVWRILNETERPPQKEEI